MFEARWYEEAPWTFPAPLRPSRFVPLSPSDAAYNVEVDLASIKPFGGNTAPPRDDAYLYCDYRTLMGFYLRRVGAGRSGYYRGSYLKGVGRTPLTFNWLQVGDCFATGHLPASSAARELVVSRYLEAKGKSHLINPCRGVLVADLAPELRDFAAWSLPWERPSLPCDGALQAITVKDARFARFSNITWHLNHLSLWKGELDIVRFFTLLLSGLGPRPDADAAAASPRTMARALAGAIDAAVRNLRDCWRLGVSWISVASDMTMDGRYQDIDVPLFHGPGYLGVIGKLEAYVPGTPRVRLPQDVSWAGVTGFNVLEYLHAMRLFVRYLRSTLSVYISSEFPYSKPERDFVVAYVEALHEALPPDHLLWSGRACAALLKGWIDEECEIASAHRRVAYDLVDAAVAARLDATTTAPARVAVEEVDMDCARAGWRVKFTDRFYSLVGSRPRPEKLEEARFLNGLVKKLDGITDRDELCAGLGAAAQEIARHCAG